MTDTNLVTSSASSETNSDEFISSPTSSGSMQSISRLESFFGAFSVWHKDGVRGDRGLTVRAAMNASGLNWEVERKPLFYRAGEELAAVPGQVGLFRGSDGAYLASVSEDYQVLQNAESFDFLDSLVEEGVCRVETAGALYGGRVIFVLASFGEEFEVVKGDRVRHFALLVNSHGAGRSLRVLNTTVRVCCANTVAYALGKGQGQGISLRHTASLFERMEASKSILVNTGAAFSKYKEMAGWLQSQKFNGPQMKDLIAQVFPIEEGLGKRATDNIEEKRSTVLRYFIDGIGQDIPGVIGTGWAAYNAFTQWDTYDEARQSRPDGRFARILLEGQSVTARATPILLEMLK